jgi:hypothetical protein
VRRTTADEPRWHALRTHYASSDLVNLPSFAAASRTDYGWHVDGVAQRSGLGLRGQVTRREVARRLRLTAGDGGREYGDPGDLEHVDP